MCQSKSLLARCHLPPASMYGTNRILDTNFQVCRGRKSFYIWPFSLNRANFCVSGNVVSIWSDVDEEREGVINQTWLSGEEAWEEGGSGQSTLTGGPRPHCSTTYTTSAQLSHTAWDNFKNTHLSSCLSFYQYLVWYVEIKLDIMISIVH